MNRLAIRAILAVLLALLTLPAARLALSAGILPAQNSGPGCPEMLEVFVQQEGWYASLIDPVLTSAEQVAEKLELYSTLHACLESQPGPLSSDLHTLYTLTGYFLIFAGGRQTSEDGSTLVLVDLAESDDPGVQQLRDEAGLPPPPGYVFVRSYTSRQAMPPRLQAIFADPQVAGVTIYTRYIAVLDERQPSLQQELLRRRVLPGTVSHELIHAYIHSSISLEDLGRLPKWYNEGLAIYFSGSGENHTLLTPNSILVQTTTAEYLVYKRNFDYLEARLGRQRFLELIRRSVEERQPDLLYTALDIPDERYLEMFARAWKQRQERQAQALSLAAVVLIGLGVWWMAPAGITCPACGYHDHKKAFQRGYCPHCRRPVDLSQETVHRKARRPFQVCQVCGRRHWLWSSSKVKILPAGSTVWVEQQQGEALEEPVLQTVTAICPGCQQKARQLSDEHRRRKQAEYEQARQQALPTYQNWLRRAPQVEVWFQQGLEVDSFEGALERCLRAALFPHYGPWMEESPEFELRVFPGREVDFRTEPPAGFENVLVRHILIHGESRRLYGTVRSLDNGRIAFSWVFAE
jgi:hypothetical protein